MSILVMRINNFSHFVWFFSPVFYIIMTNFDNSKVSLEFKVSDILHFWYPNKTSTKISPFCTIEKYYYHKFSLWMSPTVPSICCKYYHRKRKKINGLEKLWIHLKKAIWKGYPEKKMLQGGWQCNDASIALRNNITVHRPKHIMHNWTFF